MSPVFSGWKRSKHGFGCYVNCNFLIDPCINGFRHFPSVRPSCGTLQNNGSSFTFTPSHPWPRIRRTPSRFRLRCTRTTVTAGNSSLHFFVYDRKLIRVKSWLSHALALLVLAADHPAYPQVPPWAVSRKRCELSLRRIYSRSWTGDG